MKAANQQLESKFKGGPQIWCERLQCNISIGGCRARHEKAQNPHRRSIGGFWNAVPYDIGCEKCQQAEQIKKGKWEGMTVDMESKKKAYEESMAKAIARAEADVADNGGSTPLRPFVLASVSKTKPESDLKRCAMCK